MARHIQLKAGTKPKPIKIAIQSALSEKPGGCVLWIHVSDRLEMGRIIGLAGRRESGSPTSPDSPRVKAGATRLVSG